MQALKNLFIKYDKVLEEAIVKVGLKYLGKQVNWFNPFLLHDSAI